MNAQAKLEIDRIKNDPIEKDKYQKQADAHNALIMDARQAYIADQQARMAVVEHNKSVIHDAITILGVPLINIHY
jgi:hypothetical protein